MQKCTRKYPKLLPITPIAKIYTNPVPNPKPVTNSTLTLN